MEPSYISKYERGKVDNPQFKTLEHFAKCMGMSIFDLIREEEPEEALSWEEQSDSRFLCYQRLYDASPLWKKKQIATIMDTLLIDVEERMGYMLKLNEQMDSRTIMDDLEQQIKVLELTVCTATTMGADNRPMLAAFTEMKRAAASLRELLENKIPL